MKKRERVIRTLELEKADVCPIYQPSFEKTGSSYQIFQESKEAEDAWVLNPVGDITEPRFWHADCWGRDPFILRKVPSFPSPSEYPELQLKRNGSLMKSVIRDNSLTYTWYVDAYFKTKERVYEYWERYGRPSEWFNQEEDFRAQKWEKFCKDLEPHFYPIVGLATTMWEAIFEGMGADRVAYYMRKDPKFMHEIASEYSKLNIKAIKGLADAGVEVIMMADDLGQKNRTLLSLRHFREFLLPEFRKMFQEARKRGMFFVLHSCGNITDFLPDLIEAGLSAIQSLEPASGIDLKDLNEKYGDKIAFMGGIDSSVILNFGTKQDVIQDVKKCIKNGGSNGGYFPGTAHNILDVPWENILTLRDAMIKYRKYPLKFDL